MLTCPWCGLRLTDEFVLLEGASSCGHTAPQASLIVGERWWHRLGCGRPFIVRHETQRHRAAVTGPDGADDVAAHEPVTELPTLPALLAQAEPAVPAVAADVDDDVVLDVADLERAASDDQEIEAGEMDPGGLDEVAVAGVTVDLAGDPPLEYRRPIGIVDAPADPAADPPEERPEADRQATDPSASDASGAPFSFTFFGSAAAPEVDDGNGPAEATRRDERDLPIDRFRSGPRREGARELNRPTRRPIPARTGPGGTPREVRVTRRAPIAYGSAAEPDPAPTRPDPAPEVGSGSPATDEPTTDGPATDRPATGEEDAPATDAAGPQRSSLFARAGSDRPTGPGTPPSGADPDAAFAGALQDAVVEAPPRRATRSTASRRIGLFDDRPPRDEETSEVGDR